jgi:hypothetical protein
MVKLLVEPSNLELSQRGSAQPAERGGKPSVEKMLALCELILREERLAEAARAPEPKLLRELDEIKAAFTRAIGENNVNRMVELGHDLARINKEIERSSGKFDPRSKAFERVAKNPEHAALAPYLRYLSAKQG